MSVRVPLAVGVSGGSRGRQSSHATPPIHQMSDFKAKCTIFDFRWAPPQTPLGQLTALPRPLAIFKGPTSEGKKGKEGKKRGGKGTGR